VPRYFTLLEAESFLPEVERLLESLIDCKAEYDAATSKLEAIVQRLMFAGGMIAPREEMANLRSQKDAVAGRLKAAAERFDEIGCQLKDLDIGLVDFPTLYRSKEVYLCWKRGEKAITYWHHVEDGFRGRKPIDSEFLSNHSNGSVV
jgi:hypothetical protein